MWCAVLQCGLRQQPAPPRPGCWKPDLSCPLQLLPCSQIEVHIVTPVLDADLQSYLASRDHEPRRPGSLQFSDLAYATHVLKATFFHFIIFR